MPDYEKMYFELAARIADAVDLLVKALQRGEETYMDDDKPILMIVPEEKDEK
ncbi:MAG: hypothetical protein LBN99_00905 [Oscillospiraceae bacterium]|jgi:hypothetical protein|nr:hypothetical protein [Oscillospiraceae bacterium]